MKVYYPPACFRVTEVNGTNTWFREGLKEQENIEDCILIQYQRRNSSSRWIGESERKKTSHCKCIITFEISKNIIKKFAVLPKMRKEEEQVEFLLRCGSLHKIRTTMDHLWPKRKQNGVST